MLNYIKFGAFLRKCNDNQPIARSFIDEQYALVIQYSVTKRTTEHFHDSTCCWVTTPELWKG